MPHEQIGEVCSFFLQVWCRWRCMSDFQSEGLHGFDSRHLLNPGKDEKKFTLASINPETLNLPK